MTTPISISGLRQFSVAASALLLLSSVGMTVFADEPPPLRPVVVTGAGETAEKATEDALRNAVEQAVGALIDAKTMVEGDQVIQDKILRMSNAFVERYDVLKRWSEGNLQYCRISAQVKSRELRATLAAEPVFKGKVEGENLGAQVLGELTAKAGTGELFEQFLKDLQAKTLFAKVTSQPRAATTTGSNKVVLQVPVEVGVDLQAYESIVASWLPKLRAAARSKSTRSLSFKPMDPVSPDTPPNRNMRGLLSPATSASGREGSLVPKLWMGNLSPSNDVNHSYFTNELNAVLFASREKPPSYTAAVRTVAVISGLSKSGRASVESLSIDKDVFCTLLPMIDTAVVLNAAVLDKVGKEVSGRSETFRARLLGTVEKHDNTYGYGTAIVVYPGHYEGRWAYTTTWNGFVEMPVASQELESLSSLNLNIGVKRSKDPWFPPCQ